MKYTGSSRGWSVGRADFKSSRQQKGQALIYGIFILLGGLASLFFLFNTGQITREKTKLVNTADAVAYSAGVMNARALNFDAYTNRALVANEVLVAQMVSISSWSQYTKTHAENFLTVFPGCVNPYSAAAGAVFLYGAEYGVMCFALSYAAEYVIEAMEYVPDIAEGIVTAVEVNKAAILLAQRTLHTVLPLTRGRVMDDVARANYADVEAGAIQVEPGLVPSPILTNDWNGFTRRYEGAERTRFAEVARLAAYSDDFVEQRRWNATALLPDPASGWACVARNRRAEIRRRGGTELIDLDEWKAEDTASFYQWRTKRTSCRERGEVPLGWGEQQAHPSHTDPDESGAYLGGSPGTNPRAHGNASSEAWEVYTGLPSFYELSEDALNNADEDPRMRFAVRVIRRRTETVASEGRSLIPTTDRIYGGPTPGALGLNNYTSGMPGDMLAALSTSETFFERPFDHRNNRHGESRGRPRELASLFNPYWQVHLVGSDADILRARLLQAGF